MKITAITATAVNVPLTAPIRWSWGIRKETTRLIIQIDTDEGIRGIGETMGRVGADNVHYESRKLIGQDPFNIERILAFLRPRPYFFGYAGHGLIAGIEMACWDIIGKASGKPVWALLGGRFREKIAISGYVFTRARNEETGEGGETTPEQLLAYSRRLVQKHGFNNLKLKVGASHPDVDIATIAMFREAFGPNMGLRIDPNGTWSPQTALAICKQLAPYNLEYIEDPTWGIEAMARLRRDISIPLSTNMCVVDFDQIPTAFRLNAVDVILGDVHKWGGILATKKLAAVCDTLMWGMCIHSGAELGISEIAKLHLATCTPNLSYAIDTHYPHLADDIIVGGKMSYQNGTMMAPDKPGLGVELDPDRFARYAEANRKAGLSEGYEHDPNRPRDWCPKKFQW
ncbi:MAG: enolase C-terminal domain-like protein [Lentisphaeria bacterium]|nr:enolase C-terminal domain-like protein [Lentisphaeria bacterium]